MRFSSPRRSGPVLAALLGAVPLASGLLAAEVIKADPAAGGRSTARTVATAGTAVAAEPRSGAAIGQDTATGSGAGTGPVERTGLGAATGTGAEAGKSWRVQGNLSEACTCGVPCTCNFGGAPSPNHYCWAIFSLDIEKGHYGDVTLDGLHLACGNAAKGSVWYVDQQAAPEQAAALRAIAEEINRKLVGYWKGVDPKIVLEPQFTQLGFKSAKIVQQATEKGSLLRIGELGSFESDYLIGIDGKTPIVVENNWSWNIQHGIKGKTRQLKYKDEFGNLIDSAATNANQGKFDWSDQTAIYLR